MGDKTDRRGFFNKTVLGAAAAGAAYSMEEKILLAAVEGGQAEQKPEAPSGEIPCGKIGNISIARLLIGGNLIGGWAHSRDLIYTSRLFKAYNTDERVCDTLALAERMGINTIQIDPVCQSVIEKYRKERGGKIQTMVCFKPEAEESKMADQIKSLLDQGATLLYTHGEFTDHHTMNGRVKVLAKAIEMVKKHNVPAGIGSHSLETPIACEKNSVGADYYVKTFHMDRYWSASPEDKREEWCWYKPQSSDHDGFHDNIWCLSAEKTAEFMETVEKPWVAFKVMAAGAIHPRMAFSHAFRNGADFIIAGMFDFQVEEDAKFACEALRKLPERKRPWRA